MYVSGSIRFSFGTIRTNVRNFFLIFLCNCKIKFYICITKTSLSYGVMVTQQILVLLFLVRIQVAQHRKPAAFRLRVFRFQPPPAPPLPHLNAGLPARRSPPVKEPPRFPRRVPSCKGAARVPRKKEPPGFPQKRPPGSPHKRAARIGHVPPLTGTRKSEESYRPSARFCRPADHPVRRDRLLAHPLRSTNPHRQ